MKRNLLLLIVTLLTAVCPVIAQTQTKTLYANITLNPETASGVPMYYRYTLTFTFTADYPQNQGRSGEGVYTLPKAAKSTPGYINKTFEVYAGRGNITYNLTERITKVVFDSSVKDARPTTMSNWFNGCERLEKIEGLSYLNTSEVTDMYRLFSGCKNITSALDLSNFDVSKVTDMSYMFYDCEKLSNLNVKFKTKTSSVTNMSRMFYECKNLKKLDLSNFDTSNVTDMSYMFYDVGNNFNLDFDVSSFNTSKVTDMSFMFYHVTTDKLDLSKFDTSNVTTMRSMFSKFKFLDSGDLIIGFDTSNVTDMHNMFSDIEVSFLDISKLNTGKLTSEGKIGIFKTTENRNTSYKTKVHSLILNDNTLNDIDLTGLGTVYDPVQLTRTFDRNLLGTVSSWHKNLSTGGMPSITPPYYSFRGGYFTIADYLNCNSSYTPSLPGRGAKNDGDLWQTNRTLKANVWNTLLLPVSLTPDQMKWTFGDGYEACAIDSYDGTTLKFKTITGNTTANKPIMVKPQKSIEWPTYVNVKIEIPTDETYTDTTEPVNGYTASFIGTYSEEINLGADCYYYYNGTFYRSAGASTANNTRAYFKFSDVNTETKGAPAKRFVVDDGTTVTAIDTIDGKHVNADLPAYNLAGQRVGKDYKGVVIVGGKKILRK